MPAYFDFLFPAGMNLSRPFKYLQKNGPKRCFRKRLSPLLRAQAILNHKIPCNKRANIVAPLK